MEPRRWLGLAVALAVLLLCVQASRIIVAEWAFRGAERELGFWGHPEYHPEPATITGTRAKLERALNIRPGNPDYLLLYARALMWQAYWAGEDGDAAALEEQALSVMWAAGEQRPAHLASWRATDLEYRRLSVTGELRDRLLTHLQRLGAVPDPDK